MDYSFSFFHLQQNYYKLLDGLRITLELTVAANVIGITAGFLLSLLTLSKYRFVRCRSDREGAYQAPGGAADAGQAEGAV